MSPKQKSRFESIEFVFLDVGGTLLHPWPNVGKIYQEHAAQFDIQADAEEIQRNFKKAFYQTQDSARANGRLIFGSEESEAKENWLNIVKESFGTQSTHPNFSPFFDQVFEFFASQQAYSLYPDVIPLLDHLQRRKIRIGILSNWDYRLMNILQEFKLHRRFDTIVISFHAGAEKPSSEIFQYAESKSGVASNKIMHIGDGMDDDYRGALNAGWNPILIDRKKRSLNPKIAQISSLFDLIE